MNPESITVEVESTAPVTRNVVQEALGFSGPDFIPGENFVPQPREESQNFAPERVYLDPSGEDFVPSETTSKRKTLRDKLIDKLTQNIMDQHAEANQRYERAQAFIEHHAGVEDEKTLSPEVRKRLINAVRLVEKGPPMDLTRARQQAIYAANQEVIR